MNSKRALSLSTILSAAILIALMSKKLPILQLSFIDLTFPTFSPNSVLTAHNIYHHSQESDSVCDNFPPDFPPPDTDTTSIFCVDRNGCCNFTTVQSAIDAIGATKKRTIIWINAGIYYEKVMIPRTKPNITFQGQGLESTAIVWNDTANSSHGTFFSASVTVFSANFIAKNISFMNVAPIPKPGDMGGQAVAIRIGGDEAAFWGCGFFGAQDTLHDDNGRHYFKDCYIQGSIDFVFGNARSIYEHYLPVVYVPNESWSQLLETLPLPNIKWICPTAPTRPVAAFGGFPCTAWFDVGDLSADGPDDVEGIDASAAHVANLLSTEPADIKVGIGGFSMGAATALYSATCYANGKYSNGNPYPVNLSVVVGLSGWLPCSRNLRNRIEASQEAMRRAASLPILLCHGKADDVVLYKHGQKSVEAFSSTGFRNLSFKTYNGLGHYTVPEEMDEVCKWLTARLGLDRSHS